MPRLRSTLKLLACAALCAGLLIAPVPSRRMEVAAQTTMVWIDPQFAEVAIGDTVTVDIAVANVTDLYGVSLEVHFDSAVVEVDGTQVTPGACPSPDFVVQNSVDNVNGIVYYDATSLTPSPPCSGDGVIASITFYGLADGISPIEYESWILSDSDGLAIPTEVQDGIVEVSDPSALLATDPVQSTVNVSRTTTVDIVVTEPGSLYGIEFSLAFDPALAEVVDDNPGSPGVQIAPGSCPSPDFVVQNEADNTAGTVSYGATALAPSGPCTAGGVVASVTFHGLSAGQGDLDFTAWVLSDPDGVAIPTTAQDGALTVLNSGWVSGTVELQGRANHAGAEVCAWQSSVSIGCTTTDSAGAYELALPAGTYEITVEMARYLDAEKSGIVVAAGATTTLSKVRLLGGDTNDDDAANILDLALIGSKFRFDCGDSGWDARADINDDCTVNLSDLVLVGGNWHYTSPVAWP